MDEYKETFQTTSYVDLKAATVELSRHFMSSVQLVDQQRIINSFNALLDCRVEDHVVALFTVTDFVDNTPEGIENATSDEYWDSVEELYNQLEKPNKLENSLITIKLCQIMSLLDQGRVMAALLSFSKLSNALKSLTDKPVKSLKSIWTEHHCTHKESPCSAFNSSSLRYFSMQMVEEVRSHLVKLSLDLCLVLFETQKLNSLNDSLLNGIIQQVGLLFLESHLTQNHFTNVYEDFTKGFNQDNLRFFSLLQSVKNLWVSSHKTISCLNCEVDQSSNVFDNFLLYKLYPLSNTQNKDSLLQPAVNAAKKTLEVLPSAAASMFLRPPCMTSDILPQNHILEQTLKDSQEDDNISRHSDVATVVTDLNSSSFSTPFNETKSKALTCLRNSTQNTAYDNSEFLTQQRSFNGDRSIIIPALITEQEALLKNLTGFSNTETFSNHLLDSVQLTQSPLSKSLTLHDPNKKEVEHILQDVNQISRGQEDLSNVIQNQTQITIPNNSAIQEEQQKISPDGENLSRTFPCSFMKADNTFETRENFLFSLPNATAIKKKNSLQYFKPFSVSSTESQDDLNKDISANFTSVLSKKLWSSTSVSDTNHILLRKNRKKHSSVRHFKKSYYQITSHSDTPPSSRKHVNHAENTRNLFPLITNKLCPQLHRTINFSSPASLIRTNSKPSDYFIQKKSVSHNRTALKNNVFHNSESDSYSSNYFTRHHEKLLLEQNKNQTVLQQFSDTEGYVKDISVAPLQRNKKKTFTVVKGKSSSNTANDQNQHSATLQTNEKLLFTHEQEIRKISQRSCNSLTGKKKKNRMPHRSFNIDSFKSHASINQDELLNGSKTNKKCTTKSDSEEHLPIDLDNFYFNNIDKSNKVGQRRIPTVPLNNVREHVKNGEGTKTSDVSDVERNIRQLSITSVPKCNKSTLKILQNESFFFSSTSHNKKTSTDHHANQWEPESANKIDALTEIVNSLKSETCARNKATSSVLLYSNDKKHVTRSFQKPENPLKDLFKNQCPPKPNSPNFLRSLTSAGKWIFSLPFYETQDEKGSLKQINSKIPNYSKNDAVKEKNEEKSFDFSTSFASKDSKKLLGYGRQSNQSDKVLLVTPFRVKKDFKENKAKTCWSDLSSISSLNTISSSSKSRTTFKKSKKNLSTQQKDISGAETHNSFESAQNALTQQMKTEDNVLKQTVKDNNNWDDEIFSLVDSENSSSYNVSNQLYSSTKRNSQSLNRSKNTKEKLSSLNSNEITTFKHNFSKKSISLPIIIEPLNSLHDDFFHDNFNAPTYLDPLLSSSESSDFFFRSLKKSHSFCNETCLNIHSDLHPQKKHKNDERNTWKSQFSSAFFGCTTPANATNAINRGSVALLKRHSISVFPAQSDFQNVNNPAYSRISKHCPNQFDGLQTKIHTNSSSMQDCIDIIPLLSNGSLNTTSNNIHWNTDLEPTLSDLDRKTSFNDSIAIYESLPTLNFQERSCEKMSKDSKTTSAYSHQSPEGKADIINSWKESKSSTHSIQHTVFTEKENDLMNDGNPSLNNCCSEMAQPRGTDKRASKKVSLKSLFTDRLHSTEGHCDSSEVLSSTIRHEKLSAQSKDTTTLPLHSQIFSLENKNVIFT
ncbi:uncharacterized protein LOC128884455 [Hylaeus volcanicus]|uniref:uncharacterized protein LOC128884455 n=1 Tax=Hylaeus volcanicus TaxID=313075 RepID=UPI0023B781E0|nr:uncharacterized protein LOC128884455 [Hylaeus volcanicus]